MAFLQGKTPISFLQELCTKRGITPQYDLIANEGAVHEPTFVFKVTAGDVIGTGKGASKKKAKHDAAKSVLQQMMGLSNGQTTVSDEYTQSKVEAPSPDALTGNPVGELQEMTQKRLWPPPVYDFTSEQGPPHAREFVCTVRLFNLSEQGVGKSKKIAKRNAAYSMMQRIKQGLADPQPEMEVQEEFDEETIPLPQGDIKATYTALKNGAVRVPTLTPPGSQQISQFYQLLKSQTGKSLNALHGAAVGTLTNNFCQLLQEISEEQRFEVTYVDIPEAGKSGFLQCLVQLSTMPVAVCHGTGHTKDEAHAQAAYNSLQYLKIMTKKA